MEDILASIRRIIADDQSQGGRLAYAPSPRPTNGSAPTLNGEHAQAPLQRVPPRTRTPYDDVLDLARLMPAGRHEPQRAPEPEVGGAIDEGATPVQEAALEPVHASHEVYASHQGEAEEAVAHDVVGTALTSPPQREAGSEVSSLRARLPEPAAWDVGHDDPAEGGEGELLAEPLGASVLSAFETLAATVVLQNTPMLERVMRDLLRPLLKTWLDDNLPALVERLVRNEIERVARGRG